MKASLNLVLTFKNISTKSSKRRIHREVHSIPIIGETYIDTDGKEKVKPMDLRKLDEWIYQKFPNEESIRSNSYYQEKVTTYLKEHRYLNFDFSEDKNGLLKIVVIGENNEPEEIRVLYSSTDVTIDSEKSLKKIKKFLQDIRADAVCDIAKHFDFMFGIQYHWREIYNPDMSSPLAYYAKPIYRAISQIRNGKYLSENGKSNHEILVSWIYKRINNLLKSESLEDQNLGYYYVRLLDNYIVEKYNYKPNHVNPVRKEKKLETPVSNVPQPKPIIILDDVKLLKSDDLVGEPTVDEKYSASIKTTTNIDVKEKHGITLRTETMEETLKPEWYRPVIPDDNIIIDREDPDYGKAADTIEDKDSRDRERARHNRTRKIRTETMEETLKPEWYSHFLDDNVIIDREDPDYGKAADTLVDKDNHNGNKIKQKRIN